MAIQVEQLELEIKTNAESAAKGLEKLSKSMTTLKEACGGYSGKVKKLAESLSALNQASSGAETPLNNLDNTANNVAESAKKASSSVNDAGKSAKKSGKDVEQGNGNWKKLFQNMKRIAMYRAIRTVLKALSEGFKEGVSNMYQWSKMSNGTFAQAMDSIASSLLTMKNAIGAAVAPLLEGIAPLLSVISDLFARAAEYASRFFALIFNKDYYYRAADAVTEYASALGAVKRQLLGFDELNVLSSSSSGGSSSSSGGGFKKVFFSGDTDYTTLEKVLKLVFNKIDEPEFEFTGDDVANCIVAGLTGIAGMVLGFELAGVPGAIVGTILGATMGINFTKIAPDLKNALLDTSIGRIFTSLANAMDMAYKGDENGYPVFTVDPALQTNLNLKSLSANVEKWENFKQQVKTFWQTFASSLNMFYAGTSNGLPLFTTDIKYKATVSEVTITPGYDMAINDQAANKINEILRETSYGGTGHYWSGGKQIQLYANGGTPDTGSLFWAGENGAELVTQVGGKTTVFNEEQLVGQLSVANEGVISALSAVGNAVVNAINKKQTGINTNDVRMAVNNMNMRYGV